MYFKNIGYQRKKRIDLLNISYFKGRLFIINILNVIEIPILYKPFFFSPNKYNQSIERVKDIDDAGFTKFFPFFRRRVRRVTNILLFLSISRGSAFHLES